jgi:hypothetical protein
LAAGLLSLTGPAAIAAGAVATIGYAFREAREQAKLLAAGQKEFGEYLVANAKTLSATSGRVNTSLGAKYESIAEASLQAAEKQRAQAHEIDWKERGPLLDNAREAESKAEKQQAWADEERAILRTREREAELGVLELARLKAMVDGPEKDRLLLLQQRAAEQAKMDSDYAEAARAFQRSHASQYENPGETPLYDIEAREDRLRSARVMEARWRIQDEAKARDQDMASQKEVQKRIEENAAEKEREAADQARKAGDRIQLIMREQAAAEKQAEAERNSVVSIGFVERGGLSRAQGFYQPGQGQPATKVAGVEELIARATESMKLNQRAVDLLRAILDKTATGGAMTVDF